MHLCVESAVKEVNGPHYPDDDGVVPLEGWQEFVPAEDLGLVERPEATEHFNITLSCGVRHDPTR